MKRKTQLFYLSGHDSRFITFSNYPESLTGNFLSVDTKLYPSRFLCLYIDWLNVSDTKIYEGKKKRLIRYLVSYYESKLAVLRDALVNQDINVEHHILPFNYLLEALYKIEDLTDNGSIVVSDTPNFDNEHIKLVYISDIVEQDYNGTFTDTICSIDLNNYSYISSIIENDDPDNDVDDVVVRFERPFDEWGELTLYGWEHGITEDYDGVSTRPDHIATISSEENIEENTEENTTTTATSSRRVISRNPSTGQWEAIDVAQDENTQTDINNNTIFEYYVNSYIKKLTISKSDKTSLIFNCIIPLYDVVNVNYKNNFNSISKLDEINLVDSATNNLYTTNVPLGMWFTMDGNPITLYKDKNSGYSQTWSLLITSQFKAFPYSADMPSDMTSNSNTNAFTTFSQVLASQSDMVKQFEKMTSMYQNLINEISEIRSQIANIGTSYNIDGIHRELLDYEKINDERFEAFVKDVNLKLEALRWKTTV